MDRDELVDERNINENILNMKYAVRGPIHQRALEIERELQMGAKKPFERVIRANVGDCHALGQKPITFIREVLSAVTSPALLDSDLPDDVKKRARKLLDQCASGSVGAYSPSSGLSIIREHCAEFIRLRDGIPSHPQDILIGSGVSDLVKNVLSILHRPVDGKRPSVMVPIPQYPLFSATLAELGFHQASYYLDEDNSWQVTWGELERCYQQAVQTCSVKALVIINPGNPTGQLLSPESMEAAVRFAHRHQLVLLADEVYQDNIVSKPFISFKKLMYTMGPPHRTQSLISFLSVSKGFAAECGLRSGYAELTNLSREARQALAAMAAVAQCPNVLGQIALDCVVKPPRPGDASYPLFCEERSRIHATLKNRSIRAREAFNLIPGFSHSEIDGSMFAFPRIELPERAIREAESRQLSPDELYCTRLLEETGICVTPGSGFGQKEGTHHFRITILHEEHDFQYIISSIKKFHLNFIKMYT